MLVHGNRLVNKGEWAGWETWGGKSFERAAGPFYSRIDEHGEPVSAFRAAHPHMNGQGSMHGGCLMTFADSALFTIASPAVRDHAAVTLSLTVDFLDSVRLGELVEARGRIGRAGRSIVFADGLATANGRPAMRFSGTIKIVGHDNTYAAMSAD